MRIRGRGIFDFFGIKMHEIISRKPRRVEPVQKTPAKRPIEEYDHAVTKTGGSYDSRGKPPEERIKKFDEKA